MFTNCGFSWQISQRQTVSKCKNLDATHGTTEQKDSWSLNTHTHTHTYRCSMLRKYLHSTWYGTQQVISETNINTTTDCLQSLTPQRPVFTSNRTKVFVAFLDASKAFDKVWNNRLFVKLLRKNVPIYLVLLLRSW